MFDYLANPARFMRIADRLFWPLVVIATALIGSEKVASLAAGIDGHPLRIAREHGFSELPHQRPPRSEPANASGALLLAPSHVDALVEIVVQAVKSD